jgi:hypothetical protein
MTVSEALVQEKEAAKNDKKIT